MVAQVSNLLARKKIHDLRGATETCRATPAGSSGG
jgi:hypothetical protein